MTARKCLWCWRPLRWWQRKRTTVTGTTCHRSCGFVTHLGR